MDLKNRDTTPFAAIGIFLGGMYPLWLAITIFIDGEWTFNVNTLSDLGISENEVAAHMFNGICMLAGLFIGVIGLGKAMNSEDLDKIDGIVMALAGIFLFLVGVYTKNNLDIHKCVAFLFFLLILAAIIISMIADYKMKRRLSATLSSILVVIIFAAFPGFNFPGFEVIMTICVYIWLTIQGVSMAFSKYW